MVRVNRIATVLLASITGATFTVPTFADRVVEEVVVTARKKDETLQDVPVTITSVGGEQLDNFQIDQPAEIAARVPNFNVQVGGSGSGGTMNLRGVGSSAISAAFDSAIARTPSVSNYLTTDNRKRV